MRQQPGLGTFAEFLGLPAEALGRTAICEMTGPVERPYVIPFLEARMGENHYYMYARGLKGLHTFAQSLAEVRFISGPCLFSSGALRVVARDGSNVDLLNPRTTITQPIADIIADPQLSLYELDACARLSRLIIDIAARLPAGLPYSVTLDIPSVQYYCYLLEAYECGLMNKELLLRWFDLVDQRHRLVASFMKGLLGEWAAGAGMVPPEVRMSSGLGALGGDIVAAVRNSQHPQLSVLVAKMTSCDPIWRMICEIAAPKTYVELVNYSYVAEEVRLAISDHAGPLSLAIAIEDHYEHKIYEHAQRLLKEIRRKHPTIPAALIGFYPLEPFLISGGRRSTLYLNDPGKAFRDEEGKVYTVAELLRAVYGEIGMYATMPV